ncbi:hypothetical protein BJ742DRAFT_515249 [Cladochytrium replicatum]|nr:hypothetical protein BJ742DRAFT_515249 [Cladochytrium replicatum]
MVTGGSLSDLVRTILTRSARSSELSVERCEQVAILANTEEHTSEALEGWGVALWNEGVELKATESVDYDDHGHLRSATVLGGRAVAMLRWAAVQLILKATKPEKAGCNGKKILERLLTLAVKAGKSFLDICDLERANEMWKIAGENLKQLHLLSGDASEPDVDTRMNNSIQIPNDFDRQRCPTWIRNDVLLQVFKAATIWLESKSQSAFVLLNRGINEASVPHLLIRDAEDIVSICLVCARATRKGIEGLKWLKKAAEVVEGSQDKSQLVLKSHILALMAGTYIHNNLPDKADSCIELALKISPQNLSLYQLRLQAFCERKAAGYMMQDILEDALKNCLESKTDEKAIKTFSSMIKTVLDSGCSVELVLNYYDQLLRRIRLLIDSGISKGETKQQFERLLVLKLSVSVGEVRKEQNNETDNKAVQNEQHHRLKLAKIVCDELVGFQLAPETTRACQLVLWLAGDAVCQRSGYSEAIEWYQLALRFVTQADTVNGGMLSRKIAICQMENENYTKAREAIQNASTYSESNNGENIFISLLIELRSGGITKTVLQLIDELASSCSTIARSSNDEETQTRSIGMLVLAADAAMASSNKLAISCILERMIRADWGIWKDDIDGKQAIMAAIRCAIKMARTKDPRDYDAPSLFSLISYFEMAQKVLSEWKRLLVPLERDYNSRRSSPSVVPSSPMMRLASTPINSEHSKIRHIGKSRTQFVQECCWIYQNAWNSVAQLTPESDIGLAFIPRLVPVVLNVMELVENEISDEMGIRRIANLLTVYCYVVQSRSLEKARKTSKGIGKNLCFHDDTADTTSETTLLNLANEQITICHRLGEQDVDKSRRGDVTMVDDPSSIKENSEVTADYIQQLYLMDFEIKLKLKRWDDLKHIVQRSEALELPLIVLQRYCDLVSSIPSPSTVQFLTYQAALNGMMRELKDMDVSLFSQWYRMLITTSLDGNNKYATFDLFQQLFPIIHSSIPPGQSLPNYPQDELKWLAVTSWNIGCDYFSMQDMERARAWCDIAVTMTDFVPNSAESVQMRSGYLEIFESN